MMIRISFLVFSAVLLLNSPVFATDIGVFNAQVTTSQSEIGKAAQKRMESLFSKDNQALQKQEKELQSELNALQKQAAALSQKAREEKQTTFARKAQEFEGKRRDMAMRVQREQTHINQNIAKLLIDAANAVGKKKKLDLILDASVPGIFFAAPSLDVGDEILSELNRLWKAAGSKFTTIKTGN